MREDQLNHEWKGRSMKFQSKKRKPQSVCICTASSLGKRTRTIPSQNYCKHIRRYTIQLLYSLMYVRKYHSNRQQQTISNQGWLNFIKLMVNLMKFRIIMEWRILLKTITFFKNQRRNRAKIRHRALPINCFFWIFYKSH